MAPEIVKVVRQSGRAPTLAQLASKLDAAIRYADGVLWEARQSLERGEYLDAVADIQSYFFTGDSRLEHDADALLNALPDEDEEVAS